MQLVLHPSVTEVQNLLMGNSKQEESEKTTRTLELCMFHCPASAGKRANLSQN